MADEPSRLRIAEPKREGVIAGIGVISGVATTLVRRGRAVTLSAVRLGGDPMTDFAVLDAAGRRRSPATMPGYHAGRAPRNKGELCPADPPTVEEISR